MSKIPTEKTPWHVELGTGEIALNDPIPDASTYRLDN